MYIIYFNFKEQICTIETNRSLDVIQTGFWLDGYEFRMANGEKGEKGDFFIPPSQVILVEKKR